MTRGSPYQFTTVGADLTLDGNTETAIATVTGVSTDGNTQIIAGTCAFGITPGSDVTTLAIAVYRNVLGGTAVDKVEPSSVTLTTLASVPTGVVVGFNDQPGEVGNMTYVVTAKSTGAAQTSAITAPVTTCVAQ